MPTTGLGITYPASTGHTRLWEHLQAVADDVNTLLDVPDPVAVHGNGTNNITATSWADLPTVSCVAAVTNPHPSRQLLCEVRWGAWMTASANAVRMCPRVSGALTLAAGVGGLAVGWGVIPRANVEYTQFEGSGFMTVPVSGTAATVTVQAYREAASGTQQVNYPTLLIMPLRYV